MHTLLCVCPPRVESLFSPVLSTSCNQIPLAFKFWFSRNSFSHCWTPRLGSLTWGSEPSRQWVDFCALIVLLFVSHPPSGYGIWFYRDCTPPTISLQLLLCLWIWGIFVGEFQCLPVDDIAVSLIGSIKINILPLLSHEWATWQHIFCSKQTYFLPRYTLEKISFIGFHHAPGKFPN